jgi:hypothetical protein
MGSVINKIDQADNAREAFDRSMSIRNSYLNPESNRSIE